MNKHDRDNLNFLLYATESELSSWYKTASSDDVDYAHALMTVASLEMVDEAVDRMECLPLANRVIEQFRIKQ